MTGSTTPLTDEITAALGWWRLAGVDCDFSDEAEKWMGPAKGAEASQPSSSTDTTSEKARSGEQPVDPLAKVQRIRLLGDTPPRDLDQFRNFWLQSEGLDSIGPRGRIAPRGSANPELMVLVIDPEERDRDRLLSGQQGSLLDRMIAAMGLSVEQTYIASALPRHTPMADTMALAAGGLDQVTLHHITLAAPKRLIAFGANIPPLLGHEPPKDISSLREINHDVGSTPLLVCEGLDSLMGMPRLKSRFWRRWLEWSPNS